MPKSIRQALTYLGPIIEERLAQEEKRGPKWPERPVRTRYIELSPFFQHGVQNDLISWLLENTTQDYNRTIHDIAMRILTVNFSAIHTTTMVSSI